MMFIIGDTHAGTEEGKNNSVLLKLSQIVNIKNKEIKLFGLSEGGHVVRGTHNAPLVDKVEGNRSTSVEGMKLF